MEVGGRRGEPGTGQEGGLGVGRGEGGDGYEGRRDGEVGEGGVVTRARAGGDGDGGGEVRRGTAAQWGEVLQPGQAQPGRPGAVLCLHLNMLSGISDVRY